MPKKEDKSKIKEIIDPMTGEVIRSGHHHKHRSKEGQERRGKGVFRKQQKNIRERLDPSDGGVRRSRISELPLKGKNRNARKAPRRRWE